MIRILESGLKSEGNTEYGTDELLHMVLKKDWEAVQAAIDIPSVTDYWRDSE